LVRNQSLVTVDTVVYVTTQRFPNMKLAKFLRRLVFLEWKYAFWEVIQDNHLL